MADGKVSISRHHCQSKDASEPIDRGEHVEQLAEGVSKTPGSK